MAGWCWQSSPTLLWDLVMIRGKIWGFVNAGLKKINFPPNKNHNSRIFRTLHLHKLRILDWNFCLKPHLGSTKVVNKDWIVWPNFLTHNNFSEELRFNFLNILRKLCRNGRGLNKNRALDTFLPKIGQHYHLALVLVSK